MSYVVGTPATFTMSLFLTTEEVDLAVDADALPTVVIKNAANTPVASFSGSGQVTHAETGVYTVSWTPLASGSYTITWSYSYESVAKTSSTALVVGSPAESPWYDSEDAAAGGLFCPDEAAFFSAVSRDLVTFAGTDDVAYYGIEFDTNYDPVYGEADPSGSYRGPWSFKMVIEEYEEAQGSYTQEATDEGMDREYDAIGTVSKEIWNESVLNDATPGFSRPREGDVVQVLSTSSEPRWFSVLKVDRHGHVLESNMFVEWKLTLKERQSMSAARRI